MTRSSLSIYSPEITNKAFRAKAKEAGLTFRAAAEKRALVLAQQKIYSPSRTTRRHPQSRTDGTYWDSTTFTCARKTHGAMVGDYVEDDAGRCEDDTCPVCEQEWEARGTRNGEGNAPLKAVVLDSLLDIARPAKPKGVAKEFEVVEPPRRVIVLQDELETGTNDAWEEDWSSDDDFGWEVDLFGSGRSTPDRRRHTYSAVVKGLEDEDEVSDVP